MAMADSTVRSHLLLGEERQSGPTSSSIHEKDTDQQYATKVIHSRPCPKRGFSKERSGIPSLRIMPLILLPSSYRPFAPMTAAKSNFATPIIRSNQPVLHAADFTPIRLIYVHRFCCVH
jgi:hypothetical protein